VLVWNAVATHHFRYRSHVRRTAYHSESALVPFICWHNTPIGGKLGVLAALWKD
jgi:hypothetical protein